MSKQNALTLITPIKEEKLESLYDYLNKIKYKLEKGDYGLFKDSDHKHIHYLRWVVIDDTKLDYHKNTNRYLAKVKKHAPKLILSSNFDGSINNHLETMFKKGEDVLDTIYSHCEDYPSRLAPVEDCIKYLKKHRVKEAAFYKGSPGRSVIQIQNELKLRNFLKNEIETNDWEDLSPSEIHKKLRDTVWDNKSFEWAKKKFRMPRTKWFNVILVAVTALILLPILLPFLIIWVIIIQYRFEEKDEVFTDTRADLDEKAMAILEEYEDLGPQQEEVKAYVASSVNPPIFYQNQFSQLVEMKKGTMRLLTFKGMMLLANFLIPNIFVKGKLMNIPTIHFARWVLFDDNKRVLFFSNFDGSWQQYLGDFIDQSGWGLTGIFSNTTVFPKSRFLGFPGLLATTKFAPKKGFFFPGGAYDEEHFLTWSRNSEIVTQVWYAAYPDLSIKNVNNNSHIRELLGKQYLSDNWAKEFLELI